MCTMSSGFLKTGYIVDNVPLSQSLFDREIVEGEDREPGKEEVSIEGRAATPAFRARPLRPYVPLRCSPERKRARDGYPLPSSGGRFQPPTNSDYHLQAAQQFIDADEFHAEHEDICRDRKFFRCGIGRRDTDIAVVRIFSIAVSYTHLDVYKRQILSQLGACLQIAARHSGSAV